MKKSAEANSSDKLASAESKRYSFDFYPLTERIVRRSKLVIKVKPCLKSTSVRNDALAKYWHRRTFCEICVNRRRFADQKNA